MFDYDDGDFYGIERQGAVIFTEDPYYFDIHGPYPTSNPPAAAAVKRELFFTLVHEIGHLFNLTHSYEKTVAREWKAPTWMRVENRPAARSWMNYPERASGLGGNAKPFYDEFRFRFDDQEHLFLRHAPGKFIVMGGENWGENSARAFFDELDARLHLRLSALKPVYQLGEFPVLELRLKNIGAEPVLVDGNLDITGDAIEVVVLGPDSVRRAVLPALVYWKAPSVQMLAPGASLYRAIDLAFSKGGQPISRPGWHRVEVVYTNCDGKKAVAYCRIFVAPPDHVDDWGVINALLTSDVGRFLYFAGSRSMAETDQRLKWYIKKLGPHHPVATRLIVARALPYQRSERRLRIDDKRLKWEDGAPEWVMHKLDPILANLKEAARSFSHIRLRHLVDVYADCATQINKRKKALKVQHKLLRLLTERRAPQKIIMELHKQIRQGK